MFDDIILRIIEHMKLANKGCIMNNDMKNFYRGRLEQIFLYITYSCNFGCKHCLIGDRNNNYYTLDEIKNVLSKIKMIGGEKVTLLGGEPTQHPQLMEIISLAKSMNFRIVLDTNGSFSFDFFKNKNFLKLDRICFSIDGYNEEIHDKIREKGSFQKILKHIKLAKKNNIEIKFTHTITKDNFLSILKLINLALKLEIDELNIHVASYNGRAKTVKDPKIITPKEWYNTYSKIKQFIKGKNIKKTKLRIPPRYCTKEELNTLYADHKCVACEGDRMLILPKDKNKGDLGGPLYACGLLIGELSTLGWNDNNEFIFNKRDDSEYNKYYSKNNNYLNGISICPIMSQDTQNNNYLKDDELIPLCISYKPQLY